MKKLIKVLTVIWKNNLLPLNILEQSWIHRFTIFLTMFLILLILSLSTYTGKLEDLYLSTLLPEDEVTTDYFVNSRELNFYKNIKCYMEYEKILHKKNKLPIPEYPLFAKVFRHYFGSKAMPAPTNCIEIIEHLRRILGSGIKIRNEKGYVLRYKPNTRTYIEPEKIPDRVAEAFIHAEDHFFYIEPGGINIIRVFMAAYSHFMTGSKKGNSSISEQVYKHYFGSTQTKSRIQKFIQLLGAMYLSYYSDSRKQVLKLYVQSIPGSFWGDHCYGSIAIAKNYLGKDKLTDLTERELAWLSRIALYPNSHGQDYANFYLVRNEFRKQGFDINNNSDIIAFASNKKNLNFLEYMRYKQLKKLHIKK